MYIAQLSGNCSRVQALCNSVIVGRGESKLPSSGRFATFCNCTSNTGLYTVGVRYAVTTCNIRMCHDYGVPKIAPLKVLV